MQCDICTEMERRAKGGSERTKDGLIRMIMPSLFDDWDDV